MDDSSNPYDSPADQSQINGQQSWNRGRRWGFAGAIIGGSLPILNVVFKGVSAGWFAKAAPGIAHDGTPLFFAIVLAPVACLVFAAAFGLTGGLLGRWMDEFLNDRQ